MSMVALSTPHPLFFLQSFGGACFALIGPCGTEGRQIISEGRGRWALPAADW